MPDSDQTVVTRTRRVLPEPTRDVHRSGWEHYLSRLVVVTEGGDPGPGSVASLIPVR